MDACFPSCSWPFDYLDAVPEGVVDVASTHSRQLIAGAHLDARFPQLRAEGVVAFHDQRWMRLLGRSEVVLDAQMNLGRAATEPTTASNGERDRLWDALQPENPRVEALGLGLSTRWHGELNVVQPDDLEA